MKKRIYFLAIILLVGLGFSACEKFLDEVPKHSLTDANAITNYDKAKAAVGGIYATFENDSWSGALYVALATKAGFGEFTGESDYNLSYSESNEGYYSPQIWEQFYRSVNAANFAINGIDALSEASFPDAAAKTKLIAEARCLRAWVNANLLWSYGHWWAADTDEYGILWKDQVSEVTNVRKARITVGESYQKIYADLDFAIENLPDFSTSRYVSKQFAQVLKAQLLLRRGGYNNTSSDLESALTLVNTVLSNHPATFAMDADMANVYKQAWDSKENLFARYLEDDGSRSSTGGYWYSYGIIYAGNKLPLGVGGSLTAGLTYGADWFKQDPRWPIATGEVRTPETWDETMYYTFKKLARLGRYGGQQASPPDEKYAAYYFRFPQLYIMKSELLARTGASVADAIAPINEMRSKRTNPILPALHPSSKAALMDMIFKEIFMETCLENGSGFFASLRFQKDGKPYIVATKEGKALEMNKVCWPIPKSEIVNNKLMVQNPDLK